MSWQIQDSMQESYVGWDVTSRDTWVNELFSPSSIQTISRQITNILQGVHPTGRPIVVTDEVINSVLSSVYRFGTRANVGDIYTRFIIPQDRNDYQDIVNQTINIIVSYVRDEIDITENNKKLTVWNTLYGDFNPEGLRQYSPIKLRKRHPQYMAFNMNY